MQQAIDFITGESVSARVATIIGNYVCPCCFERVKLYKNNVYTNHFRHWHGTRRQDCENYQGGFSQQSQGWKVLNERRNKLGLYINTTITGYLKSWDVELYISAAYFGRNTEYILVHEAIPAPVKLLPQLEGALRSGIRAKVLPKEKYVIEKRISGFPHYEQYIGLSVQKLNFFSYSELGSRKIEDEAPLIKGEKYVIVLSANVKKPKEIKELVPLGQKGDWQAYLYEIPAFLRDSQYEQLEKILRRSIMSPGLKINLVYPLEVRVEPYGGLLIPPNRDVILSFSGLNGQFIQKRLIIKTNKIEESQWYKIEGRIPLFVNLGKLSTGMYDIIVPGEQRANLTLIVDDLVIRHPEPVAITFVSEKEEMISLYSNLLPEYMSKVRAKKATIASISLPHPVKINLKKLNNASVTEWFECNLYRSYGDNWKGHITSVGNQLIEKIIDAINDRKDFVLDAGGFGRCYCEKPIFDEQKKDKSLHLTKHIRRQIEWLKTVHAVNDSSTNYLIHPFRGAFAREQLLRFDLYDQKLLNSILACPGWEFRYLGHLNMVIKGFKKIGLR